MLPPTNDVTNSMNFDPQPASGRNASIPKFHSESVTELKTSPDMSDAMLNVNMQLTNEWGMRNNQVDRIFPDNILLNATVTNFDLQEESIDDSQRIEWLKAHGVLENKTFKKKQLSNCRKKVKDVMVNE
jgi:hypothetical protein